MDDSPSVTGPAAPMPTGKEAWGARFRLRIIERLTLPPDKHSWRYAKALAAANSEWEAIEEDFNLERALAYGITDDPVEAADECLEAWSDGA